MAASAATERALAASALAFAVLSVLPLPLAFLTGDRGWAYAFLAGSLPCGVAGFCLGLAWRSRGPPSRERRQGRAMAIAAMAVAGVVLLAWLLFAALSVACVLDNCA